MRYYNPSEVTSPRDHVSNVRVLFDGGVRSVSIAEIEWDGDDVFVMRWNVNNREWNDTEKLKDKKICVGMPSSRGYPVWFVIPAAQRRDIDDIINRLQSE